MNPDRGGTGSCTFETFEYLKMTFFFFSGEKGKVFEGKEIISSVAAV